MSQPRWYVELYPMFNGVSRYIREDGSVGRLRHHFNTKREAEQAEKRFYKGPHRGLTMDHVLVVDKEVKSINLHHHTNPVDEYRKE